MRRKRLEESFVVSGNDISTYSQPVETINPVIGVDGFYD